MKKIDINALIWLIPFIFFIAGYCTLSLLFPVKKFPVPHVIGKSLAEATALLANQQLNVRILATKEDNSLQEGTVIAQQPIHQEVKANQPVFLTISTKEAPQQCPSFTGLRRSTIEAQIPDKTVRMNTIFLPSAQPNDLCLGHIPRAGEQLQGTLTLFVSGDEKKPILWPSFIGQDIDAVQEQLKEYGIQSTIHEETLYGKTILDQRPRAGSLILLDKVKPLFST